MSTAKVAPEVSAQGGGAGVVELPTAAAGGSRKSLTRKPSATLFRAQKSQAKIVAVDINDADTEEPLPVDISDADTDEKRAVIQAWQIAADQSKERTRKFRKRRIELQRRTDGKTNLQELFEELKVAKKFIEDEVRWP